MWYNTACWFFAPFRHYMSAFQGGSMLRGFLDFLSDNVGFLLLVLAVAVLACVAYVFNQRAAANPPPVLPTAKTRYEVTVLCDGGFLNTQKEVYFTNHEDGKGPAFSWNLYTSEVHSFSAGDCMYASKSVDVIWTSQPPFDGNRMSASQDVIDQFLADEAALGH